MYLIYLYLDIVITLGGREVHTEYIKPTRAVSNLEQA